MLKEILSYNENAQAGNKELAVLKQYFPQCFTAEGKFDIEAFKDALPAGTDITDETSGFTFLGKNYARMLTNMDTTTIIRPDAEHNALPENKDSKNVYISGDNLDALQHLVKSYYGQVKVIYIDPPYNTGSDGFVYNDKFDFTAAQLAEKLDIAPERAERILSMTKRGSSSHAAWLTFMLPRLTFARDLLKNDGVIFISIDDNEQANLKLLCDEVFGEENYLGGLTIIVKPEGRRYGTFAKCHEYCLVYSKDIEYVFTNEITVEGASFQYQDEKGGYNLKGLRNRNVRAFNSTNRPNLRYPFYADILHPDANNFYPVSTIYCDGYLKIEASEIDGMKSVWRWGKNTAEIKKDQLLALKGTDGNFRIFQKERKLTQTAKTVWNDTEFISNKGTAEVADLIGNGIFDFPKPVALIKQFVEIGAEEDSIVLDFFGGSSTTAHAMMQKNSEDSGNRKYILVQLQEPCKPDSEAAKAGYKTIDEVGMERIKRAAKKIKEDNPLFAGDLGFKHYTLVEPKEDVLQTMVEFDPEKDLMSSITVDDFGVDAILRTWLVRDGYGLTDDAEELMFGNYKAYYMKQNGKEHLYFIEPDNTFSSDSLIALMDKYNGEEFSPKNIVIFGYSFGFTHREELQKNLRALKDGNKSLSVNIDIRY